MAKDVQLEECTIVKKIISRSIHKTTKILFDDDKLGEIKEYNSAELLLEHPRWKHTKKVLPGFPIGDVKKGIRNAKMVWRTVFGIPTYVHCPMQIDFSDAEIRVTDYANHKHYTIRPNIEKWIVKGGVLEKVE